MSVQAMAAGRRLQSRAKSRVLMSASAAALGWAVSTAALALPVNPTIFANSPYVGTAATFNTAGPVLTVTQNADRVVIDWDSFNITSGQAVVFNQPGADSIAFNRVDPSQFTTIDGGLTANGSVWLFSPGGLLFGPNAFVSTGSFFGGLGTFDDFQANESVGLSDLSIHVTAGPTQNDNILTVASGAVISANSQGFVVLQGSKIDMDGQVGGNGQQVGYIISEGGTVFMETNGLGGWAMDQAYQVSDPTGRGQPYFNHTGTTLSEFIRIDTAEMFETNFEMVINLDGVMDAASANPDNGHGFNVNAGSSIVEMTGGRNVVIQLSGNLSTGGDFFISTSGDVETSGFIVAQQDFDVFAYGDIDVGGTLAIGLGSIIHAHGEGSQLTLTGDMDAQGVIDLATTNADSFVYIDGVVTSNGQINFRSGNDLTISGDSVITADPDGNGGLTDTGVTVAAGQAFNVFTSTGYIAAGDVIIESGASIVAGTTASPDQINILAHFGTVDMDGDLTGSRIAIRANDDITIGGSIFARDEIAINASTAANPGVGGEIIISGSAELESYDRLLLFSPHGGIIIESGASLASDVDDAPTSAMFPVPNTFDSVVVVAADNIIVESGATLDAGGNFVYLSAQGADEVGFTSAAIDFSGEATAQDIQMIATTGSIRVRDGAVLTGGDAVFLDAARYFVLEDGAVISAGATPAVPREPLTWPYAPINENVDIAISASDMAIYGDLQGDTVILLADNAFGYAYLGGNGGGANVDGYDLGPAFILSNAEFQNIDASNIIILAGSEGTTTFLTHDSDIEVLDLTIDPSVVDSLVLGTGPDNVIFVTGAVTMSQQGSVDLWIGGVSEPNGDVLTPVSFIPGNIVITGSIGTAANPFGTVSLIAMGDIGMGSVDFVTAAEADPEFSALLSSDDYAIDEGHIFIAADGLSITTNGRVIQQNTGAEGEFAGLLLGFPVQSSPLISAPDELEGVQIGGAQPFTLSFTSGPTRVELFGAFTGVAGTVEGYDAAEVAHLAADDLSGDGALYFNSCQFGGGSCGAAVDVPQFETPTDVGVEDFETVEELTAEEEEAAEEQAASEDQDSELFRSLVAPGADRAYEQERIGEPITGSGNEDLWTGRGDGVRP